MKKLECFSVVFTQGKAVAFETPSKFIVLLDGRFYTVGKDGGIWSSDTLKPGDPELHDLGISRVVQHWISRSELSGRWTIFFHVEAQRINTVRVDLNLFDRIISPFKLPAICYDRNQQLFEYIFEVDEQTKPCRVITKENDRYLIRHAKRRPACYSTIRLCHLPTSVEAVEIYDNIWKLRDGSVYESSASDLVEFLKNSPSEPETEGEKLGCEVEPS